VYYNYDKAPYISEELSGLSFFYKDSGGNIFHTYSTYGRGDEKMLTTYMLLDMTPKGRKENGAASQPIGLGPPSRQVRGRRTRRPYRALCCTGGIRCAKEAGAGVWLSRVAR
jgi:Bacterial protein of unknown function (DUF899)